MNSRRSKLYFTLVALLVFALALADRAAVATADTPTPGNLDHAVEAVAKYYETHPNLEGWSSQATQWKAEGEKAIASLENEEKMYLGTSELQSKPPTGLGSTSELHIKELVEELSEAWERLGTGEGATVEAIGSEALDGAEGAGLLTSSAGGVLVGLIPLAATLTYEDIVTGTNFISVAVFSSKEDDEQWNREPGPEYEDVGAEKLAWMEINFSEASKTAAGWPGRNEVQLLTPFYLRNNARCPNGEKYEIWRGVPFSYENNCPYTEATLFGEHFTSNPEFEFPTEAYGRDCLSSKYEAPAVPETYLLMPEVEGRWYVGSCETYHGGTSPTSAGIVDGHLPGWEAPDAACQAHGSSDGKGIAGYPPLVGPFDSLGDPTQYCIGEPRETNFLDQNATVEYRARSRMHMSVPQKSTKADMEKLESEGHHLNHLEGHVPTLETQPEVFKNYSAKLKEHGQRRQEEYECHIMQCEQEHVPAEPETELEPDLPEKPEGESPRIPGSVEVPNCFLLSMTGTECKSYIEESGFTKVEIDVVTWEHADISKPADSAIATEPGAGSYVETSSKIVVDTNPSVEDMPAIVPDIDHGVETGAEYKERLESEGWAKVKVGVLPEIGIDPSVGPDQAAYTNPAEGTATAPGKETEITVEENPETAPEPSEGHGHPSGPTLPGIHFPHLGPLCRNFPFGVPCWLYQEAGEFTTTAVTPTWTIHMRLPMVGYEVDFHLSLEPLDEAMEIIRPVIVALSVIGLVLLFYRFAVGGSPGGDGAGGDDGGEEG